MSRSIRVCSYLLLPVIYLLVNVKIAQLGGSFPITIVTFLPALLLLYVDRISLKKLMIALGIGAGLTLFNFIFGQSLDASKYVTSTLLFGYTFVVIGLVWSIRFKSLSPHNYRKIFRCFQFVVFIVVSIAAVEMLEIIVTGKSILIEKISSVLIYSNNYILKFISFGGLRTTSLYFEPAFFSLALISIWLSVKQLGMKSLVMDVSILIGVGLSGSFSGLATMMLFWLMELAFVYLNKHALKKKLPVALISFFFFFVMVYVATPYILTRLEELGNEGSSSYYRIVGPLLMVKHTLMNVNGMIRFGSMYSYVGSFGILNGSDSGTTMDNGIYQLIIYFSWLALAGMVYFLMKLVKLIACSFGTNDRFYAQLWLFVPLSLFFTGAIFSPEYIFLLVCPFILRKATNLSPTH